MLKIDQLNLNIVKELKNGKKSCKQIARDLKVTENTIRNRTNKMLDSGLLDITGLVDIQNISGHQLVIIGVKLKTTDIFKKGEEFSRLKGIISVNVVTGRYDLILLVLFNQTYGLKEFYSQELIQIDEVKDLETFVVFKGINSKVPYVL